MSGLDAYLPDHEDQDRGLRLSVCADLVFLEVGRPDESNKDGVVTRTFTVAGGQTVGVDAELLLHTLTAAIRHADRDAIQRGKDGGLPVDHPQLEAIPVTRAAPIVRRRA